MATAGQLPPDIWRMISDELTVFEPNYIFPKHLRLVSHNARSGVDSDRQYLHAPGSPGERWSMEDLLGLVQKCPALQYIILDSHSAIDQLLRCSFPSSVPLILLDDFKARTSG